MARGRIFKWQDASGNITLLSDRMNGIRVLKGVLGLGLPSFSLDQESLPDSDSSLVRGVRASGRQIFLPLEIWAPTRQLFLQKKRNLARVMDPQKGSGYLFITDAGSTYRIPAYYQEGLEGDESEGKFWEEGTGSAVATSVTLNCMSPFFETITPSVLGPYGNNAAVPFFPLLPLRLSTSQILSDASQPAVFNKIKNPSFELGTITGWSGSFFGQPTVIATPTNLFASGGSRSCRLDFPPAMNGASGGFFTAGDGVPLVSGSLNTIKARILVPSGQSPALLSSWDSNASSKIFDEWGWVTVSFTAEFSTNPLALFTQQNPSSVGGYYYIDQAMMSVGGDTTYIDGDQLNCHWTGTPHNSTSYRDPIFAPTIVNNPGTKKAFPVIQVTGPGTQTDLFSHTTKERVTLNYTIAAGRTVTFDMARKRVTLDDGTNLFKYLTADDFWALEDGDNQVSFSLVNSAAGSMISGFFHPRLSALV